MKMKKVKTYLLVPLALTMLSQVNYVTAEDTDVSSTTQSQVNQLVTANSDDNGLNLKYTNPIASGTKILIAVWSDNNGQDDLVWYTADSAGSVYAPFKNHKNYGLYHIHTYAMVNGQLVGLNARTFTVDRPSITTNITKTSSTTYDIVVSNVPSSLTSISVPIWSDNNGQDDIRWYTATKIDASTYKVTLDITDHNSDQGKYSVHIYGYSTVTQGLTGLAVTPGFNNVDDRPTADVFASDYAQDKEDFTVNVNGSSSTKTIKSVRIAVWSDENGQDDLKWYTPSISDNKTSQTVSIKNHSNTSDNYIVHVYTDYTDNTTVGTNLGSYKIVKPPAKNTFSSNLTSQGISLKL